MADQTRPLAAAITSYVTSLRTAKPSRHTLLAYEADLRQVAALMTEPADPNSELTLAALNVATLQEAFAAYADTHAKASVVRAWSTWNRLCDHLVVLGWLAGNPMAAVGKPKLPRSVPHAFTDDDMRRLVETVRHGVPVGRGRQPWPQRDYALITTLAVTGLRRSELLALTIGDLEGLPGQMQVAVRHGKGDKYRAVPIDPRLEHLLTGYLVSRWQRFPLKGRSRPDDPWSAPPATPLWLGDQGQPMTSPQLTYLVQRAYRAAGINSQRPPGTLVHALRHTFATSLLENGASAVEVMGLLGHASLQTTQRYLATRPDQLRAAVRSNPIYAQLPNEPSAG